MLTRHCCFPVNKVGVPRMQHGGNPEFHLCSSATPPRVEGGGESRPSKNVLASVAADRPRRANSTDTVLLQRPTGDYGSNKNTLLTKRRLLRNPRPGRVYILFSERPAVPFWVVGGGGELSYLFCPVSSAARHDNRSLWWKGLAKKLQLSPAPGPKVQERGMKGKRRLVYLWARSDPSRISTRDVCWPCRTALQ